MADARSNYQDALVVYESARNFASKKIKMIEAVASSLTYQLPSFLGWQYEIQMHMPHGHRHDQKSRFEMNDWPDASALKEALTDWHKAFVSLHEAWGTMNNSEKIGFQPPPGKMEKTS